jgi:hypothetical protein
VKTDGSVGFDQINYDTHRAPLLAGQSANMELEGYALKVGHKTKIRCTIAGLEAGTNAARVAYSDVITVTVNR